MTIQDLIELLATYPPGLRVVVDGYEDGFDDVERGRVSVVRIEADAGKWWWEGRHAEATSGSDSRVEEAVALRRAPRQHAADR